MGISSNESSPLNLAGPEETLIDVVGSKLAHNHAADQHHVFPIILQLDNPAETIQLRGFLAGEEVDCGLGSAAELEKKEARLEPCKLIASLEVRDETTCPSAEYWSIGRVEQETEKLNSQRLSKCILNEGRTLLF